MDRRWVNTVSETSWCWPEYCMLSGSVEQRNCKLEKNLLIQRWVSLDGNIWPKITLALFYFFLSLLSLHLHVCSLSRSSNTSLSDYPSRYLTSRWLRVPWSCHIFLSPSHKIQYLSQSVWVHSPLSLGVLPVALRWISRGLIDITLAMKYAYHDQRWWCARQHFYKSSQPGVYVLLETHKRLWSILSKAAILQINYLFKNSCRWCERVFVLSLKTERKRMD